MSTPTFDTKQDALKAGYTQPGKNDKDISGSPYFGYDFERADGKRTVTVHLKKARNAGGGIGAFLPMYPPDTD